MDVRSGERTSPMEVQSLCCFLEHVCDRLRQWDIFQTHLWDLLQKLKLFDIVVPLDPKPIGNRFETLPDLLWSATDDPLALVTAKNST